MFFSSLFEEEPVVNKSANSALSGNKRVASFVKIKLDSDDLITKNCNESERLDSDSQDNSLGVNFNNSYFLRTITELPTKSKDQNASEIESAMSIENSIAELNRISSSDFSNSLGFKESHALGTSKTQTVIIKPENSAPTRKEVLNNLDKYGIAPVMQQIPFFSNIQDVGGSIKIGPKVLKVTGKNTANLSEFQSLTDGLNKYRKNYLVHLPFSAQEKKTALNNIILSYSKTDICIIKPVKELPTVKQIKTLLEKNQPKGKSSKKGDVRKSELHVPLDLGGSDEDVDMPSSLTLSFCSDLSITQKSDQILQTQTSDSSETSVNHHNQLKVNQKNESVSSYNSCLISGVSIDDTYAFRKATEDLKQVRAFIEHQHITVMIMELHILTRGNFKPDPTQDPIQAIFYSVLNDVPDNFKKPSKYSRIIAVNTLDNGNTHHAPILNGLGITCDVKYVGTEEHLFNEFSNIVSYWDPDIVAGYEIEMLSWGYLIDRGTAVKINLKHRLGRNCVEESKRRSDDHIRELKLVGRIVLDVWRLMRHEIALQSYTFESIVYHILRKRVPYYSFKTLTSWWNCNNNFSRHQVVNYYLLRVETVLELLEKLDFINRTSELAR